MNIPTRVKIGAHDYEIVFRDDLDDENMGTCRPSKTKIFVDSTIATSQQEETFFHEVIHAIYSGYGLGVGLSRDDEEKQVQALGHAVYAFLKDNDLLKA